MDIVTIFNKSSVPIAQLNVAVKRTWYTNRISRASFVISKFDDNFSTTNLQYSNFVLVQHDGELQDWVGVIVPPRSWKIGVTVRVESAEQVMSWRTTGDNETLSGVPGLVFSNLLASANRNFATGITLGSTSETGGNVEFIYNGAGIADAMNDLADDLGFEWWVANKEYNGGNLSLKAYFASRRGTAFAQPLTEGMNIKELQLVEEGEIYNRIIAYGMTDDWENPVKAIAEDDDSISAYGVHELTLNFPQTEDTATLEELAAAALTEYKQPRRKFSGVIVDTSYPEIGDDCKLIGDSVGFDGDTVFVDTTARIESMSYDPTSGKLAVILKEVL